jgi:AcrR family transcriptional regulator
MLPMTSSPLAEELAKADLRSRRKRQTRRALRDAALRLFAEQGYEATTISQIAASAGIAERTFFVHFPSKEDVLLNGRHGEFDGFDRVVAAAPRELSDLAAVEFAFTQVIERGENAVGHAMTCFLVRAEASSAVVRGKRLELMARLASAAAKGLSDRHGEESPSTLTVTVAEVAAKLLWLAVDEWTTAGPDDLDLLVHKRFALFRRAAQSEGRL